MKTAHLPKAVFFFMTCLLLSVSVTGSLHAEPTALSSEAIPTTIFGPQQYTRTTAKPNVYLDTFLNKSGTGRIVIKNGAEDGADRVSSASIYINDVALFGPNDFNKKVYILESPVTLTGNDTIKVTLASSPVSYLTIEVIQDLIPVAVTISAAPITINQGESTTLLWSTVNADTVAIDQSIGSVDLTGSLSIIPAETTLYTATATGTDGTTVTAQTTVYVAVPPPIISFGTAPETIENGDSSILNWTVINSDSVIIDQGIGSVSPSDSMSVSPTTTTTYTITASGPGGTATDQAMVTVTYPEPIASISAEPTTISAGESSTLTWSTHYADTCSIEPDIGTVPCTLELTVVPLQDTIYTLIASGAGGITTAQTAITVTGSTPLSLTITSPIDGDTIARTDVQVSGTVSHAEELETGVVVNGVVALLDDGTFVANHIALQDGENSITVIAVDVNGESIEKTLSLTAEPATRFVELVTDTESGLAPMEISLTLNTNFLISTLPTIHDSGPGVVDYLPTTEPNTWNISTNEPGIYYFTVEAQDEIGMYYSDTVAVLAMDRAVLDALLQAKWSGMKAAVIAGNLETSLSYFIAASQDKYREIFTGLWDKLPNIYSNMQDIEMISFTDGYAKYRINRAHTVNGATTTITYYIYFCPDLDGQFKIYKY